MAEISQPPPIRDAVSVAENVADFPRLNTRGPGVVHDGHEKNLQLGIRDNIREHATERKILAARSLQNVEIRQDLRQNAKRMRIPLLLNSQP